MENLSLMSNLWKSHTFTNFFCCCCCKNVALTSEWIYFRYKLPALSPHLSLKIINYSLSQFACLNPSFLPCRHSMMYTYIVHIPTPNGSWKSVIKINTYKINWIEIQLNMILVQTHSFRFDFTGFPFTESITHYYYFYRLSYVPVKPCAIQFFLLCLWCTHWMALRYVFGWRLRKTQCVHAARAAADVPDAWLPLYPHFMSAHYRAIAFKPPLL